MPHPNGGLHLLERYRFFAPALARVAELQEAVEDPVVAGGDEAVEAMRHEREWEDRHGGVCAVLREDMCGDVQVMCDEDDEVYM